MIKNIVPETLFCKATSAELKYPHGLQTSTFSTTGRAPTANEPTFIAPNDPPAGAVTLNPD